MKLSSFHPSHSSIHPLFLVTVGMLLLVCLASMPLSSNAMPTADGSSAEHDKEEKAGGGDDKEASEHADKKEKGHNILDELENGIDGKADDDEEDSGDEEDEDGIEEDISKWMHAPLDKEQQAELDAFLEPLPEAPPKKQPKEGEWEDEEEEKPDEDDVPTWKVGRTKFSALSDEALEKYWGIDPKLDTNIAANHTTTTTSSGWSSKTKVPRDFDSRKKWPQCAKVIGAIRDQSNCGSCWAVTAAAAYTDRMCIAMVKAGMKVSPLMRYSAGNLMSCQNPTACKGGSMYNAWKYIEENGIVTGSGHRRKAGCQPYPFPPFLEEKKKDYPSPKCQMKCTNKKYRKPYHDDKKYATNVYLLKPEEGEAPEREMQREIMENGPINVMMKCPEHFSRDYENGVYSNDAFCKKHPTHARCKLDEKHGFHGVRIIGWGYSPEEGKKYWLVANSWGRNWGEKGFFRILRGANELLIESEIVFGLPVV